MRSAPSAGCRAPRSIWCSIRPGTKAACRTRREWRWICGEGSGFGFAVRFPGHELLDLLFLPIRIQPSRKAEDDGRLDRDGEAPAQQRPLNPPDRAGCEIDDQQKRHHQDEDDQMDVKSADRSDLSSGPLVIGIIVHGPSPEAKGASSAKPLRRRPLSRKALYITPATEKPPSAEPDRRAPPVAPRVRPL